MADEKAVLAAATAEGHPDPEGYAALVVAWAEEDAKTAAE